MKLLTQALLALAAMFRLLPLNALAAMHCVDVNSTNATPPYASWATAATNIQNAVNAATAGDEIVVTNGTYNPVSVGLVRQPLSIRSVNGPQVSIISAGGRHGYACAHLTNGFGSATLSGFTLRDGYANPGGGAYNCTLNNCTLIGNSATSIPLAIRLRFQAEAQATACSITDEL